MFEIKNRVSNSINEKFNIEIGKKKRLHRYFELKQIYFSDINNKIINQR